MIDKKLLNKLKKNKQIKAVYLFGSCVTGKLTPLSDIDVCIIGRLNEKQKYAIMREFPEKFDVSFFDELPIYIKFRIFRDGKALFIKDEELIKALKLWTLKEYLDFKPLINRSIARRFGNG